MEIPTEPRMTDPSWTSLQYCNSGPLSVARPEPPLGFEFWMELQSTWTWRQTPLKTKNIELQGNLLLKQDLEWNEQQRWHPSPSLYAKESGWRSIREVMTMSAASQKSNDSIATTWSNNSSGNRWSSEIWWYCWIIQEVRWCLAMVTRWLDIYLGKRRRRQS